MQRIIMVLMIFRPIAGVRVGSFQYTRTPTYVS